MDVGDGLASPAGAADRTADGEASARAAATGAMVDADDGNARPANTSGLLGVDARADVSAGGLSALPAGATDAPGSATGGEASAGAAAWRAWSRCRTAA